MTSTWMSLVLLGTSLFLSIGPWTMVDGLSEGEARRFLQEYDTIVSAKCNKHVKAEYDYVTDLDDEFKKNKTVSTSLMFCNFVKHVWKEVQKVNWKQYRDPFVRRQFKLLSTIDTAALPEHKLKQFKNVVIGMTDVFSKATICPYPGSNINRRETCDQSLDPDLKIILRTSRDYKELLHVWKAWRDASGKKIRTQFPEYLQLINEAARLNGFEDAGVMWRDGFETADFLQTLDDVWREIQPFYLQMHAYVRRQLIRKYGSDVIQEDGPIPAHLLGDMWAQTWSHINDFTKPFPSKPGVDATPKMVEKKMTPLQMFQISEEFFTSLGLKAMTPTFWNKSVIAKPKDRNIVCHPSAWEFCNREDFRIKMCTKVTMQELVTVHHEMGHIQYFMQYAHQPQPFRTGANPGFHEAIGDALALSVATPHHLKKIGLLDEVVDDKEADINYLYSIAMGKVMFLPFAYLIDLWRWNLFRDETKMETANRDWWKLRLEYQGICPPSLRTESDFDAGAKFHVPDNVPYIRYFVSHIIQFQFHKALCDKAGHKGPLHTCDIYQSKAAGEAFARMLEEGSRLPWPDVMEILTGGRNMTAAPLLEYFAPLREWLQEQNTDQLVGWQSDDPMICPKDLTPRSSNKVHQFFSKATKEP